MLRRLFAFALLWTAAGTLPAAAQIAIQPALAGHTLQADLPRSQTRIVRFGDSVTVRAAVLRTSALVLAPDEHLRSISQADGERWQIAWAEYGPEGEATPVVTVTPTDCDLTTNLLILTTRRIYPVLLESPPCNLLAQGFNPSLPFDALVRYRYPTAGLRRAPTPLKSAVSSEDSQPAISLEGSLAEILATSAHYSWRSRKGYRGPQPRLVTDDGARTFIAFADGAFQGRALPLLFLVDENGERELANYEVQGSTFVVRTLLRRAALVQGGKKLKRQPYLEIRRKASAAPGGEHGS